MREIESLEQSVGSEVAQADRVPRVTVIQIGSRRNYAVPIALAQAGALERLYTDWYSSKDPITCAASWLSRWLPLPLLARAAGRVVAEFPAEKVVHFPRFALAYQWQKHRAARRGDMPRAYIWGGAKFCQTVLKYGIPPCEAIYCFSSVAKELFQSYCAGRTLRVLDQGIPPLAYEDRLVREQENAYPEWSKPRPPLAGVEEYTARQRQEWLLADVILCPSKFCWRALAAENAPLEKVRVLPFGIHPRFFLGERNQEDSRKFTVLFAGNSPIRKGLPDLVRALDLLKTRRIRAIIAGNLSSLTHEGLSRAAQVAELRGCVNRHQMTDLYRQADVLVFPTVSDVFPAVVLEAMAAGIPVITTTNCGSGEVIRDGIDGFIVPIRSPEQLAEKIEYLASNPKRSREMGRNAYERAQEYTLDRYREKLIALLCEEVGRRNHAAL